MATARIIETDAVWQSHKGADTIATLAVGRDNNFNLLRMIAATGVLVSHAYPIALGPGAAQPFSQTLGITLGTVCVYVFFAISGFFIARSFDRARSRADFLRARALRLFPALVVVLLLTVLGGAALTLEPAAYWMAAPEYFVRNATLFFLQYPLPGVFEQNPYGPAINGSLWTLNYEVLCYAGVFLIGVLGILCRPRAMAAVLALVVVCYVVVMATEPHDRLVKLFELGLPFAIGTGFYVWRERIPVSPLIGLGLAALAAVVGYFAGSIVELEALFHPVFVLALSYGIFVVGFLPGRWLRLYNRLGDYSYGVYIYAFPVQQLMAHHGITTPYGNIATAALVTLPLAVLSWHLVEAPALRFKAPRPMATSGERA